MKEWVEYSKLKMEQFTPSNALTIFKNDRGLHFAPLVDLSGITSMVEMFYDCHSLVVVPLYDTSNVMNMGSTFKYCSSLTTISQFDVSSLTNMYLTLSGCTSLQFALIKNIGKSTLTTYDFSGASVWGTGSEENRQSLIDSLITYSYDRASNGMATATIKLSATTKALLTEEEIAQITNKGFTIS